MIADWLGTPGTDLLMIVLTTALVYICLIAIIRVVGLRSFSKMSTFDFAITVAVGSVFAATVLSPSPSLLHGAIALASLFGFQWLLARLRRSAGLAHVIDNDPTLLMLGDEILHDNLRATRVTEADLRAKLREANVLHVSQVRAVVLEATGDVSVLHATDEDEQLDPDLLEGVLCPEGTRERLAEKMTKADTDHA